MREIKFMAFYKKMSMWVFFDVSKGIGSDSALEVYRDLILEGATFLQYTGLKDKNGVEIYEGNIIRSVGTTYKYIVCFEDYKFVANHLNKVYGRWGDLCRFEVLSFEIEVIGSIYEPNHLLL